jgi:hypothetical protein
MIFLSVTGKQYTVKCPSVLQAGRRDAMNIEDDPGLLTK